MDEWIYANSRTWKQSKHSNKYKHYTTRIQVHTSLCFTLNRDHNSCAAHSHLFQLGKTCQTEIQQLNKVPLLTHHGRKQVFRLLLQKQTSDSRRWWNRADPKLFSRCSKPAKPAAAWSIPLTPPPWEKAGGDQRNYIKRIVARWFNVIKDCRFRQSKCNTPLTAKWNVNSTVSKYWQK